MNFSRTDAAFWLMAHLWHLYGCRVYEDLSAICWHLRWSVPW